MNIVVKAHIALTLAAIIHAFNYPIAKSIMPDLVHPFAVIMTRVILAGGLFWLVSLFLPSEKIDKRDYLRFFLCSLFGTSANILLFYKGLSITSAVNAALIMTVTPILVLISALIVLKEKITTYKVVGIVMGLGGVLMLMTKDLDNVQGAGSLGDFMVFLNALLYGLYLVMVKPLTVRYRAITIFKWIFLIGFFLALPFGWSHFREMDVEALSPKVYYALLYIAFFATFCTYMLNNFALKYVSPSLVGVYIYLQPILAWMVSVFLGVDEVTWSKAGIAVIIFAGVYLVSWTPNVSGIKK
jgi:drug/metabolite transporter (DMT)-like permease